MTKRRRMRFAALIALVAGIMLVSDPAPATAASCTGTWWVECVASCGSQSQQNHKCTELCGATWHADNCESGLGECEFEGILCHNAAPE